MVPDSPVHTTEHIHSLQKGMGLARVALPFLKACRIVVLLTLVNMQASLGVLTTSALLLACR